MAPAGSDTTTMVEVKHTGGLSLLNPGTPTTWTSSLTTTAPCRRASARRTSTVRRRGRRLRLRRVRPRARGTRREVRAAGVSEAPRAAADLADLLAGGQFGERVTEDRAHIPADLLDQVDAARDHAQQVFLQDSIDPRRLMPGEFPEWVIHSVTSAWTSWVYGESRTCPHNPVRSARSLFSPRRGCRGSLPACCASRCWLTYPRSRPHGATGAGMRESCRA